MSLEVEMPPQKSPTALRDPPRPSRGGDHGSRPTLRHASSSGTEEPVLSWQGVHWEPWPKRLNQKKSFVQEEGTSPQVRSLHWDVWGEQCARLTGANNHEMKGPN